MNLMVTFAEPHPHLTTASSPDALNLTIMLLSRNTASHLLPGTHA